MKNLEIINGNMTNLRDDLRSGALTTKASSWRQNIAYYLMEPTNFPHVKPSAMPRLLALLDVPTVPVTSGSDFKSVTQDDYAWAVQNFINRRKDPWAFKRSAERPVTATEAESGVNV